jgi:hypothetical protein
MTKPNIHSHTSAICKKLGLEPHLVRSMTVTPTNVEAEVFLTDENGSKYIKDDGNVALETRTFEVVA